VADRCILMLDQPSCAAGSASVGCISVGPIKEAAVHVTGGTSVHVGGCSGTEVMVDTGGSLQREESPILG